MFTGKARLLGEMSWTEVRDAASDDPVVLIPMGAIEQHGPHLPIQEDSIVAEWVAHRVSERTGVIVAPALNYGHSPIFRGFAGNLSLRHETLQAVTTDIITSLVSSGFSRLVLVNNNGGNVAAVSAAAYDAREKLDVPIGHLYPWALGYELMRDAYDDPAAVYGHGSEPEHSAMLAMFPNQVRSAKPNAAPLRSDSGWDPVGYTVARIPGQKVPGTVFWDFSEISENGCTGDPSVGSAAVGEVWIDRVVRYCVDYVLEFSKNTARDDVAS